MAIQIIIATVIAVCAAGDCGIGAPTAEKTDPGEAAGVPDRLAHLRKSEFGHPSPVGQASIAISPELAARLAGQKQRLQATRAVVRDGKVRFVK
jgi:hypothetical protein